MRREVAPAVPLTLVLAFVLALPLALVLALAGCGSPTASTPAPGSAGSAHAVGSAGSAHAVGSAGSAGSAQAPRPAGTSPSEISRMVCTPKTAAEVAQVMGAEATVAAPTWANHLYSCGYRYRAGTMVLSVKELSSWPQTYAYFDQLAGTLHKTTQIGGLGQGAFIVRDGSVVVRKDWKILLVDISGMRGEVGSPPKPAGELALYVAQAILGCWNGD
jgi:hypothetical protein